MSIRRIFILSSLCASAAARASFVISLDTPIQTTTLPGSSSVFVSYTGSITVESDWRLSGDIVILFPGLTATGPYLPCSDDPAFVAWLSGAGFGDDYAGPLFQVEVQSTDATGFYRYNPVGPSGLAGFGLKGQNVLGGYEWNYADFGLHVDPVPEPASIAALSFGVLLAARRRGRG